MTGQDLSDLPTRVTGPSRSESLFQDQSNARRRRRRLLVIATSTLALSCVVSCDGSANLRVLRV